MIKTTNLYINGSWQDAISKEVRTIYNPFDNQPLATVAEGNIEDAQKAIKSAKAAFESEAWRNIPASERGRMVYLLGDLIEKNKEELAELETLNTGKTLAESLWDMEDIAGIFRYYGGLADKNEGDNIASPNPNSKSLLVKEPIGVVGMICPWNYPLLQAAWKIAPALAAGCTMVISFTGGVVTGKKIMKAAAGNVKKVALELGGKNPHILFEDADWETAIDFILNGVFFHAGQICSAGTRVMVASSIHDKVVEHLKKRISKIRLGNGLDKDTQMGPLISQTQLDKVTNHVQRAIEQGAELIVGGKKPTDEGLKNGFTSLLCLLAVLPIWRL